VTGRACSAKFATGAMTGVAGVMTGRTTGVTGAMTGVAGVMTGRTTGVAGVMTGRTTGVTGAMTGMTGKSGVVAGRGCSGNGELVDQGGRAAARSVLWGLQISGAAWSRLGVSGHDCKD
jgi:hypothetical protein